MIADKIQLATALQQEEQFAEACTLWQEVCAVLPIYTAAYFNLAQCAQASHQPQLAEWAKQQLSVFIPKTAILFHENGYFTQKALIKQNYTPEVLVPPQVSTPEPPPPPLPTPPPVQIPPQLVDTTPIMPPELLQVSTEMDWHKENPQPPGYPELSWQTLESAIDQVEVNPKSLSRIHPKTHVDIGFDSLDDLISQLEQAPRMKPIVGEIGEGEDSDLPEIDLDDMVSETLALIYAKQGQFLEAAEVYEKLVLQEPERADHFRQKAEEMRNSA